MRVAGIDPGLGGGIALIDTGHSGLSRDAQVTDLPVFRDKSLAWIDGLLLAEQFRLYAPQVVVIERVSAMPKQGVTSCFHFGMTFGSILSVAQAMHIPLHFVTPVTWKKAFKLPGGKDKKASLRMARERFPNVDLCLEKHHNRGEALLIALWYCDFYPNKHLTVPPAGTPQVYL